MDLLLMQPRHWGKTHGMLFPFYAVQNKLLQEGILGSRGYRNHHTLAYTSSYSTYIEVNSNNFPFNPSQGTRLLCRLLITLTS